MICGGAESDCGTNVLEGLWAANLRIGCWRECGAVEVCAEGELAVQRKWSGSGLSSVAIEDEAYLAWYVEQVRVGRERMYGWAGRFGVPYFPRHELCADEY
jgi:hypothetical protein